MSLAVITAIYGDYDKLKIPDLALDVDEYVLVTDSEDMASEGRSLGYRVWVQDEPRLPRMAAKAPKCKPFLFTTCDSSLWIDGAFQITHGGILTPPATPVKELLDEYDWWGVVHSERDCFYNEALFCTIEPGAKLRYDESTLMKQANHYLSLGMPRHWGLWANGIILRKHTDRVKNVGNLWYGENLAWSVQDQVSLPFAAWTFGLDPKSLPLYGHPLDNQWASWVHHQRDECVSWRKPYTGEEA